MQKHTPMLWTVVETEKLQDCRVFDVYRSTARSPRTGAAHAFFRIEADEWVNVVALTPAQEFVMVRQYRHGSDEITFEIPGGMVDSGETPAEAAVRELLEETGYQGAEPLHLGTVNPNPALFGNGCHTFLVRDAEKTREVENDGDTEHTVVELLPRADLHRRLLAGEIGHALVMAGLYWFELTEKAR
ncbi:MAG: NUDIX hydrolase [Myxococcota bacterium]|jgi:8-oxo-dGTP pyrophosphatase MutT (NUDIX family)